jgi:hypothetical protein
MTSKQNPTERRFSLPLTWIPVVVGLTILLVWRFGWWWLGLPVAVYSTVAIVSVVVHRKTDLRKQEALKPLAAPLYGLFHIESIEQSATGGYLYDIVPDFKTGYTPQQQARTIRAIEMAISDPDIDFSQLLPDIPFGDEDIKQHLANTLERLKNLG